MTEEERVYSIRLAEDNMNEVLNNPSSTYTDMVKAIDEFFDTW